MLKSKSRKIKKLHVNLIFFFFDGGEKESLDIVVCIAIGDDT